MGKWARALVTGASSGIGAELARQLAADGSDLVLVARRAPLLEELAAELEAAHGVAVEALAADLLDPDALRRVEERVADPEQPVDLLVNNAGFGGAGPVAGQEVGDQLRQVGIHVHAPLRLTHAAARRMAAAGHGGILNVSSVGGFQPLPTFAVYGASKAWMRSFSEALHGELAPRGVHVTCLCPGFVRTPMLGEADGAGITIPELLIMEPEAVVAAALDGIARNRTVVVPGALNKAMTVLTSHVPKGLLRAGTAGVTRFM